MPLERATARVTALATMALVFGQGMPSLYAVAFIAMIVSYYIGKAMCLNLYKKSHKPSLVRASLNVLVLGVIFH